MGDTSEDLDQLLLAIGNSLHRGEASEDQALAYLRQESICRRLDGENIKILIRGAFMFSLFGNDGESFYGALAAYLAASCMADPTIKFSLEVGVGNGRACAAFCMYCLRANGTSGTQVVRCTINSLEGLKKEDDLKGYVEALLMIAEVAEEAEQFGLASAYYLVAADQFASIADPAEFFGLHSSQDIVRLDCKEIFQFQPGRGAVPPPIAWEETALAQSYCLCSATRNLLLAGHPAQAAEACEQAQAILSKASERGDARGELSSYISKLRSAIQTQSP